MKIVLAYLDPGTGSLLLQASVGGFAGFWVFSRYVWHRATRSRTSESDARQQASDVVTPASSESRKNVK